MTDQFTRWLCPVCNADGVDSWNKGVYDGTDFPVGEEPNPWILGCDCWRCWHPLVVAYTGPTDAPRAIVGPIADGPGQYAYESSAFSVLEADPTAGITLLPSAARDADWSGGCVAAKGQLQ